MIFQKERRGLVFFLAIIIATLANSSTSFANPKTSSKLNIVPYSDKIVEGLLTELKTEKYNKVQDYFDYLVKTKPYSHNGTRLLEVVYDELSSKKGIDEYLEKWCSTNPTHHSAFVVRGKYHIAEAWRARGSDWGRTVTEEARALMQKRLFLAKTDLERAYDLNPKDPCSAAAMIQVCTGLSLDEGTMEGWFRKAVTADPIAYYAYEFKLIYLAPKWHGTYEKFNQFANYCYINAPEQSIVYIAMIVYIDELAKRSQDEKKFLENKDVQKLLGVIFGRWLNDYPNSTSARMWLAEISESVGSDAETIRYCNEVLEIWPNRMAALKKRGTVYFKIGEYEKAKNDFHKMLEKDPRVDYALFMLGKVEHFHSRNIENAIEFYDKAIALNKTNKYYFYYRGVAKQDVKDYKAAVTDFTTLINIDPKLRLGYLNRGVARYLLAKYEAAVDDFTTAIEIDPQDGQSYYYRGRCLFYLNEREKAMSDFEKAKDCDPRLAPWVDIFLKPTKT